ncbi:M23 family metallopeptidase [Streptomyces sp. R302]|uniref:M23 family metallopeptidase n=1 Tax=unclassified Streptomyces TaxID=2593676 RepID=UPI00145D176D|nr:MULTISPECIES: M23 family metallopeptidase [unclassified Streptomyces]NML54976.1 M23 family metallopeptidase [Streptomyces sp. R301]NML83751.1 M23 family metallopeptidase [Streptomyces sp. R302]
MQLTTLFLALTFLWPVPPPPPQILRGWHPPPGPYAAGHRGIDLAAPPGTPVLAPATGTITYAGQVAGRGVVTLTLTATGTPPLRTTFTPVTPLITTGTQVTEGTPIAETTLDTHCTTPCLHWGLLHDDTYLNPLLLAPRARSRLLPLGG